MTRPAPLGLLRAEYYWLLFLAFVLPILEAPKSIALVMLLILLLVRLAVYERPPLRAPDATEWMLLFLFGASLASTVANLPFPNGNKGTKDMFANVVICWYLYRTPYARVQWYRLVQWFTAGILIGLVWAVIEVLQGKRANLEFHSAGIVTQSAIYLAIGLTLAFGMAVQARRQPAAVAPGIQPSAVLWEVTSAAMLTGLVLMTSRGSLVAMLFIGVALLTLLGSRRLLVSVAGVLALAVVLAATLPNIFQQSRLVERTSELVRTGTNSSDSERMVMWRIGVAEFIQTDHKFFGIGPRNFGSIKPVALKFSRPLVLPDHPLFHAHNLFLTTLVEEGLVGLAALLGLFGTVAVRLVRDWRAGRWFDWTWFGAFGALAAPVIAGSFNAPFYQEHAIFAMMLFGIYFRQRALANTTLPAGTPQSV